MGSPVPVPLVQPIKASAITDRAVKRIASLFIGQLHMVEKGQVQEAVQWRTVIVIHGIPEFQGKCSG
jgi:hypothetical protein